MFSEEMTVLAVSVKSSS